MAPTATGKGHQDRPRRRRRRATYTRPNGVRHLLAGYGMSTDRLHGHVKERKGRTEFLTFCRYLRSPYPAEVRIAIVLDNFSPHLSTKTDSRVGKWAAANNVERNRHVTDPKLRKVIGRAETIKRAKVA